MLPTFVIGLREGLEAALIVSIIAAFLNKQGRGDLLRWVLAGVATAVLLCLGAGIGLDVYSSSLPQAQQEGLETVVGALAVVMVTYMVVWMKRHSRGLKGQLEGLAAEALGGVGSVGRALILMAFLAVIREGLETVVFLLAAFNESGSSTSAGFGALLGIVVAVGLGYGIYRGGVRLNLSKFFRITGIVLVFVAAGLVVNALHTAHEAGWLDAGQSATVDLSWLVRPGTVQESLLTGMLGLQARPVLIEVIGWLVYLVPVGVYVAWPPGRGLAARTTARLCAAVAAVLAVATVVLVLVRPDTPARRPVTGQGGSAVRVVGTRGADVVLRDGSTTVPLHPEATRVAGGVLTRTWTGSSTTEDASAGPARLTVAEVARLDGGRLPLGVTSAADGRLAADYRVTTTTTAVLDPRTQRVLDLHRRTVVTPVVTGANGVTAVLDTPLSSHVTALPQAMSAAARSAARADNATAGTRDTLGTAAALTGVLAAVALLLTGGAAWAARRVPVPVRAPAGEALVEVS